MARLLQSLRPPNRSLPGAPKEEEADFHIGSRYELLQKTQLFANASLAESTNDVLKARTIVLVLDLWSKPPADGDEVLVAYLADTSRERWAAGWAQIGGAGAGAAAGSASPSGLVLRRRRLEGSWEVGGRYRARGSIALRETVEFSSPEMYEAPRNGEFLILELALLLAGSRPTAKEPRLRARVRADSGHIGWITVELPGTSPLLDPLNVYTEEAIERRPALFRSRHLRYRVPVSAAAMVFKTNKVVETWVVGGKYRVLANVILREESSLESQPLGSLRVGAFVTVQDVAEGPHGAPALKNTYAVMRLLVDVEGSGDEVLRGWISSGRNSGELLVDTRDHTEYSRLQEHGLLPPKEHGDGGRSDHRRRLRALDDEVDIPHLGHGEYFVSLRRQDDKPLGITVDQSGRCAVIERVSEGGLFAAWNAVAPPSDRVRAGDTVISVNGSPSDPLRVVEELSQPHALRIVLRRRDTEEDEPSAASTRPHHVHWMPSEPREETPVPSHDGAGSAGRTASPARSESGWPANVSPQHSVEQDFIPQRIPRSPYSEPQGTSPRLTPRVDGQHGRLDQAFHEPSNLRPPASSWPRSPEAGSVATSPRQDPWAPRGPEIQSARSATEELPGTAHLGSLQHPQHHNHNGLLLPPGAPQAGQQVQPPRSRRNSRSTAALEASEFTDSTTLQRWEPTVSLAPSTLLTSPLQVSPRWASSSPFHTGEPRKVRTVDACTNTDACEWPMDSVNTTAVSPSTPFLTENHSQTEGSPENASPGSVPQMDGDVDSEWKPWGEIREEHVDAPESLCPCRAENKSLLTLFNCGRVGQRRNLVGGLFWGASPEEKPEGEVAMVPAL